MMTMIHENMSVGEMALVAAAMAVMWGLLLDGSKRRLSRALPGKSWFKHIIKPQKQQMYNFGFPKEAAPPFFPEGVTERMVRDAYAFSVAVGVQHLICALPMLPVVLYGWGDVSSMWRVAFVMGTLSDVGYDIYDMVDCTFRTWAPHHAHAFGKTPVPVLPWVMVCMLHHPLAMTIVIPMNLYYPDVKEYHQVCLSLLTSAGLCVSAGAYKFSLDLGSKAGFYQFKLIVLFQLLLITYTRVFLWFPAAFRLLAHFHAAGDYAFFTLGLTLAVMMTLFNMAMLFDSISAAGKWLPRSLPTAQEEQEELIMDSALSIPASPLPPAVPSMMASLVAADLKQRKFRSAVKSVIANNRAKNLKVIRNLND